MVLESMGADLLCMPCNSAHYFHEQIQDHLKAPLLNMVKLTVDYLEKEGFKKVAVLGTLSTIRANIYNDFIDNTNIESIEISDQLIEQLNYVIYDVVKANNFDKDIKEFQNLLRDIMQNEKVDAFILACTELPILFEKYKIDLPSVDPTDILALEIVKKASK